MLRYFLDNNLVRIADQRPKDWREAIRISGQIMKENGLVTDEYIDQVIADVETYGPYIVIVPGVAMPHSSSQNKGVLGTGIGLTIMPESVSFEKDNPEKDAKLFFMLAAKDNRKHMDNIAALSDMLMKDGVLDDLLKIKTMDDYRSVLEKYSKTQTV